ncbi:lipopolysaccharide biosynthesis protein [Pseudosporangium ferrugineum]|uniref:O-antigen/teichoic acid export membrane protein n=1 Tax=Pseudosporangium ferrugineum TaxID=439699 RepID=A0A2T0RNX5_9ACTN|nr:polysaccharide biosynthesis C-terminal domain-containing protein [Pseudosporangium ferrugineum]PRY22820.1 O-antigen/teichoic acid export membrane protein [Pseudosporangium ferrugineum]
MTAVADRDEVRRSTRSGAVGLAGAAVNGVFGFVLTTAIVRTFGADGSGALFAVIGLVTIAGAVCCLGADTGLMWAVPRRQRGPGGGAARLLPLAVLPPLGVALLVAAAGIAAAGPVSRALLDDPDGTALVRLAFAGVPVIVAATILLAAVRATRPVSAYVAVQFLLVPIARPALMIAAVLAGGGVLLGFGGWLLPVGAALLIAAALVVAPLGIGAGASLRPEPADWPWFWGFALPRAASVAIDASSMWVGVLLTGALATQAEAGVFAAVGRYALAGLLVMQGLRVAVAPQLSRLLGDGRRGEAARVYRRTSLAIVLLSWPAYLILAAFAPAFLALFGREFRAGAAPLAVLAVAMLVNVGVGLVQTVLLMSGNSRGHLAATVAGLALNVVLCLVLVPAHGALGAAVAWAAGIVTENALAAVLARRALGEPLFGRTVAVCALAVSAATGAAALTGTLIAGRGLPGLAIALALLAAGALALLADRRVRRALARLNPKEKPA